MNNERIIGIPWNYLFSVRCKPDDVETVRADLEKRWKVRTARGIQESEYKVQRKDTGIISVFRIVEIRGICNFQQKRKLEQDFQESGNIRFIDPRK